ncbi:MAG: hypothetical protein CMJ75_17065 [Planctomycetaceae bacterium]|nr:hypothetical protein [Planctomycetaceae bacterium]
MATRKWQHPRADERVSAALRSKCGHLLATVVAALYAAALFVWPPAEVSCFPKCLFFTATNLYCPGCGGQRAVHALLHMHLRYALRCNLLTMSALPFLAVAYDRWTTRVWYSATPAPRRPDPKAIWSLLGFIILFWVLRNIGHFPFTMLAPASVPT